MKHFRNSRNPSDGDESSAIYQALNEFAGASSWEQTYRVLQKQRDLQLSEPTLALVRLLIHDYEASGQMQEVENWRQHLHLLEDACTSGVAKAWKRFVAQQYAAAEAHDALVCVTTLDELYSILTERQKVVLSDAMTVMLRETIEQKYATHHFKVAARLEQFLELLLDARMHGTARAWRRFQRAKRLV